MPGNVILTLGPLTTTVSRPSALAHPSTASATKVCIIRLLRMVGVECARNLKELLAEVREKST